MVNKIGSLARLLVQEGLGKEDVNFILENKFVARNAARGLKELCQEIKERMTDLEMPGGFSHSFRARQLLFEGKIPTDHSSLTLLRIAKGCFRVAEKKPGLKIKMNAVARELGVTAQRISQLWKEVQKVHKMKFAELIERLEI